MSEMSNATNSEARLERILAQARVLKDEYDGWAKSTGENFNVFSILHMERYEVTTHSAIIAELLNPHGSHSQGTSFLKLFLNKFREELKAQKKLGELREKLKQIQKNEEYDKFKVGVETSFKVKVETSKEDKKEEKLGRIDILIESDGIKSDSNHSGDVFIVIENKIDAGDQEGQLDKYHRHASSTEKEPGIIYLTLLKDKPSEYGLGGRPPDTVVCLSYEKDIDEWLGACIKEVARIPQIRETLHQYQMIVKKLTGQPINRRYTMALKNILLEGKNYNLIPDLETAISEAKDAFQRDFWTKLEEQLNGKVKNLRYEVYDNELGIDEGRKAIEAYISDRPAGRAPGLTFSFPESENENYEIMFRIAYDNSGRNLYYGFVLYEKGKRVKIDTDDGKHREYPDIEKYSIDNGRKDYPNGWLAYKYFEKPKINFTNFAFVTEHKERNREDFKELVEELVGEICEVVKKVSEQKQGAAT